VSLGVALVAFVVRLAYFLIVRHGGLLQGDSTDYTQLAARLTDGRSYFVPGVGTAGFPVDVIRPPGYPIFLFLANAGSHVSLERSAIVQCVLGAAFAGGLTYVVGRWLDRRVGVVAGLMMALDWNTVVNTPLILADVTFSMLYACGLALLAYGIRRRGIVSALLGGLVLGAAALVKPIGLVVVVPVLLAVLIKPRQNWRIATCLLTLALVTVPWAVRNDNHYGVLTISAISTVNLYAYNAQGVLHGGYLSSGGGNQPGVADRATAQLRRLHLTTARLYSRLNSDAISTLAHHLPKAITQELWGAAHVMFGTGKETLVSGTRDSNIPSVVTTWIPLLQVIVMWALAAFGFVVAWQRRRVDRTILVLLTSALAVVILAAGGPAGYGRYRLPATPIECVFAAIGLVSLQPSRLPLLVRRRRAAAYSSA
jgi:4-amino-4-deoxy-L-arabinose transferase-like glycosyltransferase